VFREYQHLKQEGGTGRRRLFESADLDLVVWLDSADEIEGFQLSYEFAGRHYAFSWRRESGFAFNRVDTGDQHALADLSPVLMAADRSPWPELWNRWAAGTDGIEERLSRLVSARLDEARRAL
jgi:hypothetical protein